MLSPKTPQADLEAARQRFADALEAAEVQPEYRLGITAAAEALAKAKANSVLATFIGNRDAQNEDQH
ncbi:hypothetical protein WQQ_03140 [Hydrocarboniphaga effusa AP103]|uniref:Uncharacterized protein n=1 Tax=Hydrocarboniphaga effusa AP103 TaxID=1172194 RepID=I7ZEQ9_9GAMM|nr:hypothetical protein WQQ_01270 [Hydrocarboniphaga effusa AP103]EIT70177.1 hypothetical protein WQQ_03140 [Hydrocarboniphaga effusa AP103]